MTNFVRSLIFLILFSQCAHLQAGEAIQKAGNFLVKSIGYTALVPFAIASVPLAVASDLFFPGSNNVNTLTADTTKSSDFHPAVDQQISSDPQVNTHATMGQSTQVVDIPRVLEAVASQIPHNSNHPVYINLNLNNQQAAATASADYEKIPAPEESLLGKTKEYFFNKLGRATSWVRHNKLRFAFTCGIGAYSGMHIYAWYLSRTLSHASCWSFLKQQCALSELYQLPQKELLKSMFTTLEQAYKVDNPLLNAERFIKEADQELILLRRYQKLLSFVQHWHLTRFVFLGFGLQQSLPDRIQRLEFLKNSVLGWRNEHKKTNSYDTLFTS